MPLSRGQRVVFDTLLPADAHPLLPLGAADTGIDDFYAEFRDAATPFIRVAASLAVFVATWIGPLSIGRLPPLGRLTRDERERALEALLGSRVGLLRQLVVLLKLVASMSYGADVRVREAIGYKRDRTA